MGKTAVPEVEEHNIEDIAEEISEEESNKAA